MEININYNTAKKGIEIIFESRPEDSVIANMKAQGFRWSAYQKLWYAKDNAERKAFAEGLYNGSVSAVARPLQTQKKASNNPIKVGQIYYTSWGWEQTNIDFYQVVKTTDKTITIQGIGFDYRDTGFMSGKKKPIKDNFFGETKTVRLGKFGGYSFEGRSLFPTTEEQEIDFSYYA